MTSFLYNHITSQWDPVQSDDIPPNVYRVPNLPGDEEKYLEIPATKAHDPRLLRTLAKFRPPLAEADGNGFVLPRVQKNNGARKRSLYDTDASSPQGPKLDCDQIRARIIKLIDSGVRVSDFTRQLGVSNPSYYRFMGQQGPDKGSGSEVYAEASRYFSSPFGSRHDDVLRSFNPSVQKRRRSLYPSDSESDDESIELPVAKRPSVSSASTIPSNSPLNPMFTPMPTTDGIVLENEFTDSYESTLNCDQIRTLINQYFDATKDTQASFLRTLMAQYHTEDKKIQSVQLQRFRGMRGEAAGNTNPVFYAAGVFFEKIRRGKERRMKELAEAGPQVMDSANSIALAPASSA